MTADADHRAPSDRVEPGTTEPGAAEPIALWAGDSFTDGEGARGWLHGRAEGRERTYPALVSAALGWRYVVDAQCGTGFVNPGWLASPDYAPLIARLPDVVARHPRVDVVVVDAGRNDAEADVAAVRDAAAHYLDAVRLAWPAAKVIVLAPTLLEAGQPAEYQRITGVLRELAGVLDPSADAAFVQACGAPDRWKLVCEDGFHPSVAGQALYAEVLTRLLGARR